MRIGKVLGGLIATLAWAGLGLQFYLQQTTVPDVAPLERTIRFFSYFTVLTNLIVATTLTVRVLSPRSRIGEVFSKATTQTAVAVYITIVGLVYSLLLRSTWDPQGLQGIVDHLLHDVTPILFVILWIFWVPKSGLGWTHPIKWLVYPIIYIAYSLVRGAAVNWYPYYFGNAAELGYPIALRNTAFVLLAFIVVGFVYVASAKLLSRPAIPASN